MPSPISQRLEQYTALLSNFQPHRNYISLSHIAQDEGELIRMYKSGFDDTQLIRLRCYKGYQMEKDLVRRILNVFPRNAQAPFPEISMQWGDILIKGHPDFRFDGYPADCKSVPLDEHLPTVGKLPRKVYWQMQGYMRYSEKEKGLIIYESRESGRIVDYWLRPNDSIQRQIHSKLTFVVNELHQHLTRLKIEMAKEVSNG